MRKAARINGRATGGLPNLPSEVLLRVNLYCVISFPSRKTVGRPLPTTVDAACFCFSLAHVIQILSVTNKIMTLSISEIHCNYTKT